MCLNGFEPTTSDIVSCHKVREFYSSDQCLSKLKAQRTYTFIQAKYIQGLYYSNVINKNVRKLDMQNTCRGKELTQQKKPYHL